jgi:hypothetical protein
MVPEGVDEYVGVTADFLEHGAQMFRRKDPTSQGSFGIPTSDLPSTPANTFYRLDRALPKAGFGDAERKLGEPSHAAPAAVPPRTQRTGTPDLLPVTGAKRRRPAT